MNIINNNIEIINEIKHIKMNDHKIGFVPTMGALHDGHISLVKESLRDNDITIVSIFVNPLQFSPNEDLDKYPRTFEQDNRKLTSLNVDILFYPAYNDIYPIKPMTEFYMPIFDILCGKKRIGHFSGVCIIVSKLFNIINPDNVYFGLKDYQQFIIIKRLIMDLSFNINIIGMPIIREKNGLALSSRNAYLTKDERNKALSINRSRKIVKDYIKHYKQQDPKDLIIKINECLIKNDIRIDYIDIRESEDLSSTIELNDMSRVFIAAYVGNTRLIDNYSIKECKSYSED